MVSLMSTMSFRQGQRTPANEAASRHHTVVQISLSPLFVGSGSEISVWGSLEWSQGAADVTGHFSVLMAAGRGGGQW